MKRIRNHGIMVAVGLVACVAGAMGSGGSESPHDKSSAAAAVAPDIPVYYAVFLAKTAEWPKGPSSPGVDHVNAHRQYMGMLKDKGVSLIGGPYCPDLSGAILVLTTKNRAEATRLIDDDPAVKNGLFSYEIQPFYAAIRPGSDGRSS